MPFTAHDVNMAYQDGVRHERARIIALMKNHIVRDKDNGDALNEFNWWRRKIEKSSQSQLDIAPKKTLS